MLTALRDKAGDFTIPTLADDHLRQCNPLQVRVRLELFLVDPDKAARLLMIEQILLDSRLDSSLDPANQVLRVELDVPQDLLDRVSLDDGLKSHFTSLIEFDMHSIRVAEQVVEVAQNLLIRTNQKGSGDSTAGHQGRAV